MSEVFISYARKDQVFARRLYTAFEEIRRTAWIDWEGIPPSAEWLQEIYSAIEAADAIICVISTSSVDSKICSDEIAHAVKNNKRVIPIVWQPVDDTALPKAVRDRNWIFFREGDDFDAAFSLLIKALNIDLDWVRAHTRLLTHAIEWERNAKEDSFTLRGKDLKKAEYFLATRAQTEPQLVPLQIEYILASRRAATRRLSLAGAIGAIALLAISTFGFLFWQKRHESYVNLAAHFREKGVTELAMENSLAAEVLFARALTINDTEDTRERLLQARAKSPRLVWTHQHSRDSSILAISQSGDFLAIRSPDGVNINIWSTEAREIVHSFRLKSRPQVAAFSPDGKFLASSSDQAVQVWSLDADAQDPRRTMSNPEDVSSLSFSPDDKLLICGSKGGAITVWDVTDERSRIALRLPDHGQISSTVVSTDGRSLVSASSDDTTTVWNLIDGKPELTLVGHEDDVSCLALSPDGETIASGGWDYIIWIWDFRTGKKLRALQGHAGVVLSLAFSPDGKWLASGSEDGTTKLWNVERGKLLATLPGRGADVEKVAFLGPHGHGQLITGSGDGTTQRWDFDSIGQRDELVTLSGHDRATSVVAFGSQRRLVISSSADKTIRTWDLETRQPVRVFSGHESNVYTARISPDEKVIASGSRDGTVRLWDVETGASQILQEPTQTVVREVAFNRDGTLLASGGDDGKVRIWNTKDATLLYAFVVGASSTIRGLAFNPEGTLLACSSDDGRIRFWNTYDWTKILEINGHDKGIYGIVFSPNGKLLLSASDDKTAKLWDVSSGLEASPPLKHQASVWSVDFSPDGKMIVSGSDDSTIQFWSIDSDSERPRVSHQRTVRVSNDPVWWVAFSKGLVPPRVGVAGQDGLIHLIEFPKLETMFGNPDALLTEARRRAGLEVCEVNNRPVLVPIFPSQQGRIC
jgi:WD40 repeat protein